MVNGIVGMFPSSYVEIQQASGEKLLDPPLAPTPMEAPINDLPSTGGWSLR